jgi:hypothetical protein
MGAFLSIKSVPLVALLIISVAVVSGCTQSVIGNNMTDDGIPNQISYTGLELENIADSESQFLSQELAAGNKDIAMCMALDNENSSYCSMLGNRSSACAEKYNYFLIATGKCGSLIDIPDVPVDFSGACIAVKSGRCSDLSLETMNVCRAFLNNTPDSCTNRDCRDLAFTIMAVAENNIDRCISIERNISRELCSSLLSGSCEKALLEISRSIVFSDLARDLGNMTICNHIKISYIRDLCSDPAKSYVDIRRAIGL